MDGLSMSDFIEHIETMKSKYPNARVMGFGSGSRNHMWFYTIHLRYNGEEIIYEIPMYSYDKK